MRRLSGGPRYDISCPSNHRFRKNVAPVRIRLNCHPAPKIELRPRLGAPNPSSCRGGGGCPIFWGHAIIRAYAAKKKTVKLHPALVSPNRQDCRSLFGSRLQSSRRACDKIARFLLIISKKFSKPRGGLALCSHQQQFIVPGPPHRE